MRQLAARRRGPRSSRWIRSSRAFGIGTAGRSLVGHASCEIAADARSCTARFSRRSRARGSLRGLYARHASIRLALLLSLSLEQTHGWTSSSSLPDRVFVAVSSAGLVSGCAALGEPQVSCLYLLCGADRRSVLFVYLRRRPVQRRRTSDARRKPGLQLAVYLVVLLAARLAAGPLARAPSPKAACRAGSHRSAGSSASSTAWPASTRTQSMGWKQLAVACSPSTCSACFAVYALQRLQGVLPLNPQAMAGVSPDSSFNTAVSFVTNTNWQGYGGEVDDELSDPDAGAHGAELLLGRDRHRRRLALIRGFARALVGDDRQFLGRPHPLDALRAAAAVARVRRVPGQPGRRSRTSPPTRT